MASISNRKIICLNLPDGLLDRTAAKHHFRRFGRIERIIFKPKGKSCIVEYVNAESANAAAKNGTDYNGQTFTIQTSKRTPKKRVQNIDPEWKPSKDVQNELDAMASIAPHKYNLRDERMMVDAPSPILPPKPTKIKREKVWKSNEKSPIYTRVWTSEQLELLNVLKQAACTVEEKYRVLEARDKLIRLRVKKDTDLSKAKATVGICPDMCPERERLMRETQHQISLYEQDTGGRGMNPNLAVKQYSRSSADQEVPLPHDLRPVNVLQLTMSYLMHKIVDLCDSSDVNIAEWYHFLWDRTRGIRKDITQQELCCQGSVALVEQCARFHIHCSARLVAEDPSVCDQKINTENLTKCLQTLKYMYHDLSLKGEYCPNEAEFRGYVILLNLNDGNFMSEVYQLKPEVQKSAEVKFAISVYSAIDKNNYIKFFKLVRSTSYLNACILLRYFIQVRVRALTTILRCYTLRAPVFFPLSDLQQILAFESLNSTIDFVEYYGLLLNHEGTHVILDRNNFQLLDPFPLERAILIVESKRQCTVGEIIYGGSLPVPQFVNHIPCNSFSPEGVFDLSTFLKKLIRDEKEMADASTSERLQLESQRAKVEEKEPEEEQKYEEIEEPEVKMEESEGDDELDQVSSSISFPTNNWNTFTQTTPPTLFPEPSLAELEEKANELRRKIELEEQILQQQQEEEQRKEMEREAERKLEEKKQQDALKRKLEEIQRRNEEERRQMQLQEERMRKEEERKRNAEIHSIVSNLLSEMLTTVENNYKQEKLAQISSSIKNDKIKLFANKWKGKARIHKRKREALDQNPVWISSQPDKDTWQSYQTNLRFNLQDIKRYRVGRPLQIPIPAEITLEPFQIQSIYETLAENVSRSQRVPQEVFWKVYLSVPDFQEMKGGLRRIDDILNCFFRFNDNYKNCLIGRYETSYFSSLSYCVSKKQGVRNCNDDSDGLLLIAEKVNDLLMKRIQKAICDYGNFTRIPISVLLLHPDEDHILQQFLENEKHISNFCIRHTGFNPRDFSAQLQESLKFLALFPRRPPPLQLELLDAFLDAHLGELWRKMTSYSRWNSSYKNCLKSPNLVINLYNEALDRLKAIVLNRVYVEYTKFPEEFHKDELPRVFPGDYRYFPKFWSTSEYRKLLENVLDSLKLPLYDFQWPPDNQMLLEDNIFDYCRSVSENQQVFYHVMGAVLKYDVDEVLWTDAIELLARIRIQETDFELRLSEFHAKSAFHSLFVIYQPDVFKELMAQSWFYINNSHVIAEIQKQSEPMWHQEMEEIETETEMEEEEADIDLDATLKKLTSSYNSLVENDEILMAKKELERLEDLITDFDESVELQRKINDKFQETVRLVLNS